MLLLAFHFTGHHFRAVGWNFARWLEGILAGCCKLTTRSNSSSLLDHLNVGWWKWWVSLGAPWRQHTNWAEEQQQEHDDDGGAGVRRWPRLTRPGRTRPTCLALPKGMIGLRSRCAAPTRRSGPAWPRTGEPRQDKWTWAGPLHAQRSAPPPAGGFRRRRPCTWLDALRLDAPPPVIPKSSSRRNDTTRVAPGRGPAAKKIRRKDHGRRELDRDGMRIDGDMPITMDDGLAPRADTSSARPDATRRAWTTAPTPSGRSSKTATRPRGNWWCKKIGKETAGQMKSSEKLGSVRGPEKWGPVAMRRRRGRLGRRRRRRRARARRLVAMKDSLTGTEWRQGGAWLNGEVGTDGHLRLAAAATVRLELEPSISRRLASGGLHLDWTSDGDLTSTFARAGLDAGQILAARSSARWVIAAGARAAGRVGSCHGWGVGANDDDLARPTWNWSMMMI